MKINIKKSLILICFLFIPSHASAKYSISGVYSLLEPIDCTINIKISKDKFLANINSKKILGNVVLNNEKNNKYITFKGLKGSVPNVDIEAEYEDAMLYIQNYGNAMNEYTRFEECSEKYLILKKESPED
ncbi:hypothetical protein [Vibrio proteolyticus]|uniref:Uncharacterized protein n=1 Tax=Vibrio proteolyticus NBRC 13287 TaxID=1219065 RepID=U2ZL90_VIBPR|nr:hypothetical protein [Vibrio proteolyticus]GAD68516.1 hypothetical protein VPR01S_15_00340 [Vibrio proteolyticus NBRC 13287]